MPFETESVSQPGSSFVFVNHYSDSVTAPFRAAIIAAENALQGLFVDAVTINASFDFAPLAGGFVANNFYSTVFVSYGAFASALASHATTPDDMLAVAGLPTTDPSGGLGFSIPSGEAQLLGLAPPSNGLQITVTLNSNLAWGFGSDAIGALEHEITEGAMGRVGSLGFASARWRPMDLFRFTATGQRDYTGGSDGIPTVFGVDGGHLSSLVYHSAINAAGVSDGFDLADWDRTVGDPFGPGGPGQANTLSATDLQVMDILGWTPSGATAPPPPTDDFASTLADATHPFGQLSVGGSTNGVLERAGDRDWFSVQLRAGFTYTINEVGLDGGGGTLADPYLRLRSASGVVLASNDDVTSSDTSDSRLIFVVTTSGAYYVEAGAFVDGYSGSYRLTMSEAVTPPDDFASSLTDTDHVFGAVTVGATAAGALESLGDHDWFRVQLAAGSDYAISLTGQSGPGGLADAYLRLRDAAGVQLAFNDDLAPQVSDSRLIFHATASGSYFVDAGAFLDEFTGGYTVGVVIGSVASAGDDTLVGGAGGWTMAGGGGNDLILADGGPNYLRGDDGNDQISGGAAFDDINGNMGNDTEHGNAGDDWVVGGKDNDALFGDAGSDIVWGNLGNDTLSGGSGADQVRGGQGDDVLDGGSGADFVSGDRGNDTITGGFGADLFHGSQDAGIDRVLDFFQSEGDRVMLDPGTTYILSQVGADTVIDMGGANQMILVGVSLNTLTAGWIFLG